MNKPLFLNYNKTDLDREYDNRSKVSNAADYINRWTALSAQVRTDGPAQLDIAYGPSEDETLDVFPVAGVSKAPIHVFFHGGYWKA
ncbi:MAG: alpha/beta hydrolase, partial [Candidatus Competibacteraceae bacterium]|nr:alpha/beta hydrolase [Candidatus Competibacteraceae bacterium]